MSKRKLPSDADAVLQDYLRGKSKVSRLYRSGARAQPSPEVDANIIGAARAAVKDNPAGAHTFVHNPFSSRWVVPASLAAVIVLSVGLVVFMGEQGGLPWPNETRAPLSEQTNEAAGNLQQDGFLPASPPAQPKTSHSRTPSAKEERLQQLAPAASAPADLDDASTDQMRLTPAREKSLVEKMQSAESPQKNAKPMTQDLIGPDAQETLSPQAWLQQINALRRQGKYALADERLAAFKRRYPDYPLGALEAH